MNAQQFELSVQPTEQSVQQTEQSIQFTEQITQSHHTKIIHSQQPVLSDKSYKTPSVPKTFSKLLKNDKSSTPRLETAKPSEPVTIKDQIKNAFGFDDTGIFKHLCGFDHWEKSDPDPYIFFP